MVCVFALFVVGTHAKKNVIFITCDDLSSVRMGIYGHSTVLTPRIDAFAQEALVFDRMYTQVPLCTPTRTSIFTGVRPETSGLWSLNEVWRTALPDAVSLHRHFINNGYETAEIGKLFDPRAGDVDYQREDAYKWGSHHYADIPIDRLTQLANQNEPFALIIGFGEPHPTHWDLPEKRTRYRDYIDLYNPSELELEGPIMWDNGTEWDTRLALATLYGVISFLDNEVGRLIQAAKDLNVWDSTIVMFWAADHGYRSGEDSRVEHRWGKWYPDELCAHVPCIIRVPGTGSEGKRTSGIVEGVDMYPTLVDLCGLTDPPQTLEGKSFAPLFDNPERTWKETAFTGYNDGQHRSIVDERYRLIVTGNNRSLFDLQNDPKGLVDIAADNQAIVNELLAKLDAGPDINWEPDPVRAVPPRRTGAAQPGLKILPDRVILTAPGAEWMRVEIISPDGRTLYTATEYGAAHRLNQSRFGAGYHLVRVSTPTESFVRATVFLDG